MGILFLIFLWLPLPELFIYSNSICHFLIGQPLSVQFFEDTVRDCAFFFQLYEREAAHVYTAGPDP